MSPVKAKSRWDYLFTAKLAEEAERFQDVLSEIKTLIQSCDPHLTSEERNLLSVAYKNLTNVRRNSWRILETLERAEASRSSIARFKLIRQQRDKIERELTDICRDVMDVLDSHLIPAAMPGEEMVFYWKMKGDYFRYLAEFSSTSERVQFADLSLEAYKVAYKHGAGTLSPIHPTRLGLALNFAVYYHDVRKSPERACHLAKYAFDEAVACIDQQTSDDSVRDSLMILQLLRDDLILWYGEMQRSED